MDSTDVLWDRLAGTLKTYVEDYLLKMEGGKLQPSCQVDYELDAETVLFLQNTLNSGDIENVWYLRISGCKDINELPDELKRVVRQFLPRFFEKFPEYEDANCLKISEEN